MSHRAKDLTDILDRATGEIPMPPVKNCWGFDKHIPIALLLGMATQLVVFIWLGAAFYTQTNANQKSNDIRLDNVAAAQKVYDAHNTDILIHLSNLDARLEGQGEALKDIRELLRQKGK